MKFQMKDVSAQVNNGVSAESAAEVPMCACGCRCGCGSGCQCGCQCGCAIVEA
jgi:hypothetical protein